MTGISNVNTIYAQDALKYINGLEVSSSNIVDDVTGAFSGVPIFGVMNGTMYAGGRIINGFSKSNASGFFGKAASGVGNIWTSTKDIWTVLDNPNPTKVFKDANSVKNAGTNFDAAVGLKDLVKSGKIAEAKNIANTANSVDDIVKGVANATTKEVVEETAKKGLWATFKSSVGGAFKKAGTFISSSPVGKWVTKNIGGISLGGGKTVGSLASKGTSWFSKAFKKTGAMFNLVLEGGMALFGQVVPAFKNGGFGEGMKQLGKSTVKVGASTAGFVLGATAGKSIGATIGGAIGSAVPVIGTAIGAFVGGLVGDIVGGVIGSAITNKVTNKIMGKDYTDKVTDEQVTAQAAMVSADSSAMSELNNTVYAMIEQDMADDGKLSKDSEKMLKYLQQGAGNYTNTGFGTLGAYSTAGNTNTSLDTLISRIQAGDTSVYDVPADVLEASSRGYNNTSFTGGYANNYTNFGLTNPYANSYAGNANQAMNYFAEA